MLLFLQLWMVMFWILLIEGGYRIWRLKSKNITLVMDIIGPRVAMFGVGGVLLIMGNITYKVFS